jgi:hypothetical protein
MSLLAQGIFLGICPRERFVIIERKKPNANTLDVDFPPQTNLNSN